MVFKSLMSRSGVWEFTRVQPRLFDLTGTSGYPLLVKMFPISIVLAYPDIHFWSYSQFSKFSNMRCCQMSSPIENPMYIQAKIFSPVAGYHATHRGGGLDPWFSVELHSFSSLFWHYSFSLFQWISRYIHPARDHLLDCILDGYLK